MKEIFFVLLFALCALAVPSRKSGTSNIKTTVGETSNVDIHDVPYQISYQLRELDSHAVTDDGEIIYKWKHVCGASIISENWALTAAHCIRDIDLKQLRIVVGMESLDIPDGEQTFNIVDQQWPDEYDRETRKNDIALIKVDGSFYEWNEAVKNFVTLPDPDLDPSQEVGTLVLTGWGLTISDLQEVTEVEIVSNDECIPEVNGGLKEHQFDNDGDMCTAPIADCLGNFGGLLVFNGNSNPETDPDPETDKHILIGIVSWDVDVDSCENSAVPTVYTKVSHFIDWINTYVNPTTTTTTTEVTTESTTVTTESTTVTTESSTVTTESTTASTEGTTASTEGTTASTEGTTTSTTEDPKPTTEDAPTTTDASSMIKATTVIISICYVLSLSNALV